MKRKWKNPRRRQKAKAIIAMMTNVNYRMDPPAERAKWRTVYEGPDDRFDWSAGPDAALATVSFARSKLLSDCLRKSDADVILMQDADMGVDLTSYEVLAAKAMELDAIVGTPLCKRGGGGFCNWVHWERHCPTDPEQGVRLDFGGDICFELGDDEYTGAAFTAYPRTVLERIIAELQLPWVRGLHGTAANASQEYGCWMFMPDYLEEDEHGQVFVTEDRGMCRLVRQAGEKVYLYMKPRVGHYGPAPWYPENALQPRVV